MRDLSLREKERKRAERERERRKGRVILTEKLACSAFICRTPCRRRASRVKINGTWKINGTELFFPRPCGDPGYNAGAINHARLSLIDDAATMQRKFTARVC